jgi:serine/threonine protein kinase
VKDLIIDSLESAIRHLHSHGLVHNDITPANIMLDANSSWVLIDFDSCRRIGESLDGVKRTYGWHDPAVTTTTEQNDWDALAELKVWLLGTSINDFIFKEG